MNETVLLLVHSEALRVQVRGFLGDAGVRVVEGLATSEVLDLSEQFWQGIDLLLTDASPALVHQAICRGSRTNALVISSHPENINRELMPEPRVNFIEKPFAWRELKDKIDAVLSGTVQYRLKYPAANSRSAP